jgi:hypothetical protein
MNQNMNAPRVAVLVGLAVVCGLAVVAQPSRCIADDALSLSTAEVKTKDFARNIVKLRLTSLVLVNGVGAGYERALTDWFSVGASFGTGILTPLDIFSNPPDTQMTGGDLSASLMTPGDHKFSGSLGLALNYVHAKSSYYESGFWGSEPEYVEGEPAEWLFAPVFSLAYRYQPSAGGIFFESGVGLHAGLNGGVEVNIGYVF